VVLGGSYDMEEGVILCRNLQSFCTRIKVFESCPNGGPGQLFNGAHPDQSKAYNRKMYHPSSLCELGVHFGQVVCDLYRQTRLIFAVGSYRDFVPEFCLRFSEGNVELLGQCHSSFQ